MSIKELYAKLEKYWWSPEHPSTYLVEHPDNGMLVGIGRIASQDFAAFNLAYSEVCGKLTTIPEHQAAIKAFVMHQALTKQEVEKYPLGEWVTLFNSVEFAEWIKNECNSNQLDPGVREAIMSAISTVRRV